MQIARENTGHAINALPYFSARYFNLGIFLPLDQHFYILLWMVKILFRVNTSLYIVHLLKSPPVTSFSQLTRVENDDYSETHAR